MKNSTIIIISGMLMIIAGFIAFAIMQGASNEELWIKAIKHGGAFIGLLGIGATVSGFLLYLINRYQVAV